MLPYEFILYSFNKDDIRQLTKDLTIEFTLLGIEITLEKKCPITIIPYIKDTQFLVYGKWEKVRIFLRELLIVKNPFVKLENYGTYWVIGRRITILWPKSDQLKHQLCLTQCEKYIA